MRNILLFLALTAVAEAQSDTATITGLVYDASGGRIRDALVAALHSGTGAQVEARTNESGFYALAALRPGTYTLTVEARGFKSEVTSEIELLVQQRATIDFTLEVGPVAERVTVESAAPLLSAGDSSLGQAVGNRSILELPLNGRNYLQLGVLAAGVTPVSKNRWVDNTSAFGANGLRYTMNNYLLDGVDNNSQMMALLSGGAEILRPSIDAIQEFKIHTSNYSAEFGRSAGAIINVVTRSGTNGFHGSAYEFHRNAAFDAKNFFDPQDQSIPAFVQNQFGGTVGGPILKDRTFFFASWEGSRQRKGLTYRSTVPTLAQRAGDFGTVPLFDPASQRPNPNGMGVVRDLFPGNRIPRSEWDPVAAGVTGLYPMPNGAGAANNFTFNPKQSDDGNQTDTRWDHKVSDRDNLYARFSFLRHSAQFPGPLPFPAIGTTLDRTSDQQFKSKGLAAVETHTFSPAVINEFRFGWAHAQAELRPFVKERLSEQLGIQGVSTHEAITGLASFQPTGMAAMGEAPFLPNQQGSETFQFLDSISATAGRHTWKLGADIRFAGSGYQSSVRSRGIFNFSGVYTQNPQSRPGTGHSFGDFLLGLASNGAIANHLIGSLQHRAYQFYLQDDWRVNRKLTLNLGVRWELVTPYFEKDNHASNFVLEPGDQAFATLVLAGSSGDSVTDRALYNFDKNNVAPRIGLAYQLNERTVMRAAAGIFHTHNELWGVVDRPVANPPFRAEATFPSDQLRPNLVVRNGFPPDALSRVQSGASLVSFEQDFRSAYTGQWNLSVQRLMPGQMVLETAYVGSNSVKLPVGRDINQPLPGPGPLGPRRQFPAYGSIHRFEDMGKSNFHSLQLKLEKRHSNGLALLVSYTLGKALELYQQRAAPVASGRAQNNLDLSKERARTANDARHRLAVSYVYDLMPAGSPRLGKSWLAKSVLGGWQLSGIAVLQTGLPFTVTTGFDASNTGLLGVDARPNRVGRGDLPASERTVNRWFNASDFAVQPANTFGNSGRNILNGPGFVNFDVGVAKRIPMSERVHLQFRAEVFNLSNTPQFDQPGGGTFDTAGRPQISSPSATAISRTIHDSRQIQLGLKLVF